MKNWKQAVPYALPYCVFVLFGSFSGLLGEHDYFSYPIKIVLVVVLIAYWWKVYREVKFSVTLMPIVIGVLVFLAWVGLTEYSPISFFHPPDSGYNPLREERTLSFVLTAFRLGGSVLVVPIFEELFIRSFILRFLIDTDDFQSVPVGTYTLYSFAGTALLFALGHHSWEWPAAIVTGIAYNLLLYRRRQIFDCILAHAVTNLALGIYVLSTGSWGYW